MEKRAILAIALSAAILIFYQFFFLPSPPAPPEAPKSEAPKESLPGKSVSSPSLPSVVPPPALPPPAAPKGVVVPSREVWVDTPRFQVSISTPGGKITDWVMRYRGERSLVPKGSPSAFGFSIRRPGGESSDLSMKTQTENLVLSSALREGTVRLEGVDQYQLAVAAEFRFNAEDDRVEITYSLENRHRVPQQVEFSTGWSLPPPPPPKADAGDRAVRFIRVVRLNSSGLFRRPIAQLSGPTITEGVRWIAVESDDHYLAALIPQTPPARSVEEGGGDKPGKIGLIFPSVTLAPGERVQVGMTLYVGPKEYDRLTKTGVGLEKSVDFGLFLWILPMEWFSVPILWVMNIIYRYIGNYGVAIILLTILTKVLFYPLTQKSMTSMKQMQTLQPQMNALRAKYKNDKQRLQRETMELYRKHGVNPMGGCLPIVIQIPIFYALYVTLTVAVELQQSPLLCLGHLRIPNPFGKDPIFNNDVWICDLAQPDPTLILPLLMGASMFIQQKMTPTVGDPRQAKIMLLLPIVFTFTFLGFPAGLVLYWLVNNILSIAQQTYTNRQAQKVQTVEKETGGRSKETK